MRFVVVVFLGFASMASAQSEAVVRIMSHGASGTVIATGDGWSLILGCWHAHHGPEQFRKLRINLPHPAPGQRARAETKVVAIGNEGLDLSLIQLGIGPLPYVTPVAPPGHQPQGECWSVGFDEMRLPATVRPAQIIGQEGHDYLTDRRPWHGRSGGALIEKRTGYLIGVTSGYTGPKNRAEIFPGSAGIYVSLPAIQGFLQTAGYASGGSQREPFPSTPRLQLPIQRSAPFRR